MAKANTVSEGLMKGGQKPRCRRILAYLKLTVGARDPVPGTPSDNKGAGQRGIVEIDRDCVVHHTVQTGWRHPPAVGTVIRVKPCAI